jgi:outer membrane protein assembly factor BamB/predicted phosphodiesterase
MSLRFAMVTDTHVGLSSSGPAERLSLVYAAIARLAPDFVLHCGDITDTGLPGEYDRYRAAVPAALRGRIRHVPGNHDVRWDPTARELYRAHFGTAPYSFDAGGVHFTAFDPTQPLLEPGHCGTAALDWLARDLGGLAPGTPALLFQHFPVGGGHDFVDDQAALLELMARHDVRGLIAGHVHRETVARLGGLTQVTLRAVKDEAVFYWAELAGGPALAVSRMTVAGDGTQVSASAAAMPVATVPVVTVLLAGRRPARARAGAGRPRHTPATPPGLPRPQWRLRLNGSVQGGIAVAGAAVVAASTGGDVAAFHAGTGPGDRRVAWRWRIRLGPVYRRPGVDRSGRTLFVPSADRHLYALDAATGQIRWRFAADAPVLSEPLAVTAAPDGYVVFTAGDRLLAVEAATGQLAWSVPGRGFSAGRAACDGERVYTAAADGYARAHDLRTGQEAWSYRMVSGDPHRVALYSGWDDVVMLGAGAVLVATVSGSLALEAVTGTVRWTFPGSTMYPTAVPLDDGTVLLATEWGVISRVDLADGRAVWQASLGTRVQNAGLAVAGDSAWVVSEPGWLARLRLAGGELAGSVRFTRAHCYSAPAVVGDTLITGDQDGLVHGIRLVS